MEETTNKDQDSPLKSKNESRDTQRPNIITIMCALYIFHIIGITTYLVDSTYHKM